MFKVDEANVDTSKSMDRSYGKWVHIHIDVRYVGVTRSTFHVL